MITVTLAKFKRRPTKDEVTQTPQAIQAAGGKILSSYWTLGRYDAVFIIDVPDEKAAMKALSRFLDLASTETMIAIPRDEALKLAGY